MEKAAGQIVGVQLLVHLSTCSDSIWFISNFLFSVANKNGGRLAVWKQVGWRHSVSDDGVFVSLSVCGFCCRELT